MAANNGETLVGVTYTKIPDPSRYGENRDLSNLTAAQLKTICSRHGLSQSGTKDDMIHDIKFYLDMNWGGEPVKVTVPRLRKKTGPRDVFPSKRPSPPQVFDILFSEAMWNQIVPETNKYQGTRVRRSCDEIAVTFLTIV